MSASTSSSTRSQQAPAGPPNNSHGDSQHPALQGASLAFRTPQPTAKQTSSGYSGTNAAARAAFVAGMGYQKTGVANSSQQKLIVVPKPSVHQLRTPPSAMSVRIAAAGSAENLELLPMSTQSRNQSPSYIAATLAAARSSPATPMFQESPRLNTRRVTSSYFPSATPSPTTDITPATRTLVKLFESKNITEGTVAAERLPAQHALPIATPTPIRPPVPTRLSSRELIWVEGEVVNGSNKTLHHFNDIPQLRNRPVDEAIAANVKAKPSQSTNFGKSVATYKAPPDLPPLRRSKNGPSDVSTMQVQEIDGPKALSDGGNSSSSYASAHECSPINSLLAMRTHERAVDPKVRLSEVLSTPVHHIPSIKPSLPRSSLQSNTIPKQWTSPSYVTSQLTVDSLANAIVASSLATSRASSPTKLVPPLPPKRHSKNPSLFRHDHANDHTTSREHSPAKVLRHTMRDPQRPDDQNERVRKSHILKKHPNKHAEGDRKRWRDQITERERKRYEGVWAANKGLLIPHTEAQDSVNNLVVRDIWARSKLSSSMLAEVWDLVDTRGDGRLSREEFVVGMWLVDQCLKGRKLPVKVSESVWSSVRRLSGIKIPKTRR